VDQLVIRSVTPVAGICPAGQTTGGPPPPRGNLGCFQNAANSPQVEIVKIRQEGACTPIRIFIYTALTGGEVRSSASPPIVSKLVSSAETAL